MDEGFKCESVCRDPRLISPVFAIWVSFEKIKKKFLKEH